MQNNTKKIIIIVLGILLALVIARKMYQRFCVCEKVLVITGKEDKRYHAGTPLFYDYTRLIGVIEKTIELKKSFYQQFFGGETATSKSIGKKETKELLSDLYREKQRLIKFDRQLCICFKGEVPPKKRSTVRHYQRIIDKCITEVELIIRLL